jgi:hypothetical protein
MRWTANNTDRSAEVNLMISCGSGYTPYSHGQAITHLEDRDYSLQSQGIRSQSGV